MPKEIIKCAAIRTGEGHIICGPYHGKCLQIANEAGFEKPDDKFGQGFITNILRFVGRVEALAIATKENQIAKKHSPVDILLSEDLKNFKDNCEAML